MHNYCCVPNNCNSVRKDIKFHVFPKSDSLLTKWLDCINSENLRTQSVEELRKRYVCHKHFEKRFVTSKNRLLGIAYPTLFTGDEMSSGLSSRDHEDTENIPADHRYARKRHFDHNYATAMPRPLDISQHVNLSDPASTASSSLMVKKSDVKNETQTQHSVTDVPASDPTQSDSSSLHIKKNTGPSLDKQTSGPSLDEQTTGPSLDKQTSGPSLDKQKTGPSLDKQTTGPSLDKQTSDPSLDKQTTGRSLDKQTTGPSLDKQTTGPSLDKQTTGPSLDKQTSGPSLDKQKTGPSLDKQTTGPSLDKQTAGPSLDKQTTGPSLDKQTTGPSLYKQTTGPSLDKQTSGPSLDKQTTGPSLDKQTTGPSLDKQTTGPSLDKQTTGPSLDKQTTGPSLDKQTTGPSLDKQTTGPSLDKQTTGPSLYKQTTGPSLDKQTSGPSVDKQTTGPSLDKQTTGPSLDKQTTGPSLDKQTTGPSLDKQTTGPSHDKQTIHSPGPCVKDPRLKSVATPKRRRLINKVSKLSPECKRMYDEYKKSRKQLKLTSRANRALKFCKNQSFEKLTRNMGEYAKKLFWMQIKMTMKDKKARRFTLEEKIISLSILKQSPKCYKFLQKIFILPSRTTLKKLVTQLHIEPGVNPQIFELIKEEVVTWKEEKKYCSIIFDEMALEPGLTYAPHQDKIAGFVELNERKEKLADHALVFIIKGAIYKWQQPVAYYFCAGATAGVELKAILKKIVKAVGETGLIPIALISDQGSAFQSALKSLQQDTKREQTANENTDDVIRLEGFTLNVIYDPPHLIKGLRNNFLTKDILYEGKVAKWQDIIDVYKADCRHAQSRILHKLNDEHVIPEKIKKMKVKNCARVFSKTMASALAYTSQFSHYTDGTPVSESLENTSNLVGFLDDLFDSVNGASLFTKKSRGKDLRRAVTENSRHHIFWKEAIVKLKNIKFIDKVTKKQSTVPSLNNWITTLESFIRVWQFLKSKKVKIMRPRYYNSDSIENFFGQVRAYNFRSNNPDCHSFMNTYKSLLITGFIKFHNESFNCEEDNFNQLLKVNNLFSVRFPQSDEVTCSDNVASLNIDNVIRDSVQEARRERLNIHSRAYTAGWVVRKILTKVKCKNCKNKLTTQTDTDVHKWITHKEYKKLTQKKLTYPSEYTVRCFGVILKECNEYLELNGYKMHISKTIKESIFSKYDFNSIACESHQIITVQLFVDITLKLSIFNWCNIINRILKGTDIFRLQKVNDLPMMQRQALLKYTKKLKKNKK